MGVASLNMKPQKLIRKKDLWPDLRKFIASKLCGYTVINTIWSGSNLNLFTLQSIQQITQQLVTILLLIAIKSWSTVKINM